MAIFTSRFLKLTMAIFTSRFLILFLLLDFTVAKMLRHRGGGKPPSFADTIRNATISKGRDITFTCVVNDLEKYKVGWVKADTKAIQAIHHQVVTHNPRVSVTYRDSTTWSLHIKNVQEDDSGIYMCQVNTDPMIAEMAYLEVVVPPEIDDENSSGETEVEEGSSVTLVCKARGSPEPSVSWQREGGAKIVLREQGIKKVSTVEGESLTLSKVKRQDMGAYLCIANNGIPPSVSKRILLRVHFKPTLEVPLHMMGSPLGNNIMIVCYVESSPKSVNAWKKFPGDQVIISGPKHMVTEEKKGPYKTVMKFTIKNFTKEDASNYVCSASNSFGYIESTIQVYEIPSPKIKKTPKNSKNQKQTEKTTEISTFFEETQTKETLKKLNPFDNVKITKKTPKNGKNPKNEIDMFSNPGGKNDLDSFSFFNNGYDAMKINPAVFIVKIIVANFFF